MFSLSDHVSHHDIWCSFRLQYKTRYRLAIIDYALKPCTLHDSSICFCAFILLLYKILNKKPFHSQNALLHFSTPALLQALFLGFLPQCMTALTSVNPCGYNSRVITKVLVYENSVYINTDVLSNTTFVVNPDLTITVDDAPTSFDLTTTFTSKEYISNTVYPSATTLTNVTDQTPFALLIGYTERSRVRHQSGTYLGFNGTLTTTCSTASTYTLLNGQLFEQSNGITYQFSVAAGTAYEFFAGRKWGPYVDQFELP